MEPRNSRADPPSTVHAPTQQGSSSSRSLASEALAGKRKLNQARIGKLAGYFRVSPGAFSIEG